MYSCMGRDVPDNNLLNNNALIRQIKFVTNYIRLRLVYSYTMDYFPGGLHNLIHPLATIIIHAF